MKIYKESLDTMLGIVRNYTQQTTDMKIERRVYDIIDDVRTNGDAALKAYSEKFDGVSIEDFKVPQEEIDAAYESLSDDLKAALLKAKANITEFHSREIEQGFVDMDSIGPRWTLRSWRYSGVSFDHHYDCIASENRGRQRNRYGHTASKGWYQSCCIGRCKTCWR